MADVPDAAVSLFFTVKIDELHDLGSFSSCEGMSVEVTIEQREEGGNNSFVHMLAGRMKYSNVKLSRPINSESAKVAKWFASMSGEIKRTTAEIVAMSPDGKKVATWSLQGVIPVKWTGPQLTVETSKVATETLELAHHGFLANG